jgi:FolB domain-containing protein
VPRIDEPGSSAPGPSPAPSRRGPIGADVIELRGLRVSGICGVLPEEQQRPQPLEIDVDITADLGPAGASDELADTVDYGGVAGDLERVVVDGRYALLEALATELCDVVLARPGVNAVTVWVRKLRPPVPQQLATSGVRLTRFRP